MVTSSSPIICDDMSHSGSIEDHGIAFTIHYIKLSTILLENIWTQAVKSGGALGECDVGHSATASAQDNAETNAGANAGADGGAAIRAVIGTVAEAVAGADDPDGADAGRGSKAEFSGRGVAGLDVRRGKCIESDAVKSSTRQDAGKLIERLSGVSTGHPAG